MLNSVSVTDFRKDLFNCIGLAAKNRKQVVVTSGKKTVGWFVPNVIVGDEESKVDAFLKKIRQLQKKHPINEGKNFSLDIDKILYGEK